MHIIYESEQEHLKQKAAKELNFHFREFKALPLLFLASGGSSFELLDRIDTQEFNAKLSVAVLDERFTPDVSINNFSQLLQTKFYINASKKGVNFYSTEIQKNETIDDLADRFESFLRKWKSENPKGKIIITQGVGEDGHTAGIMPFPENQEKYHSLFENEKWVIGYNAQKKNKYPLRVTVTNTFLKDEVDVSIINAKGESKKEALNQLINKKNSLHSLPAKIIYTMKEVHLFTDYFPET